MPSPSRRSPAKQSPGKLSPVKRSPGKLSPVKRSPGKLGPVKRSPMKPVVLLNGPSLGSLALTTKATPLPTSLSTGMSSAALAAVPRRRSSARSQSRSIVKESLRARSLSPQVIERVPPRNFSDRPMLSPVHVDVQEDDIFTLHLSPLSSPGEESDDDLGAHHEHVSETESRAGSATHVSSKKSEMNLPRKQSTGLSIDSCTSKVAKNDTFCLAKEFYGIVADCQVVMKDYKTNDFDCDVSGIRVRDSLGNPIVLNNPPVDGWTMTGQGNSTPENSVPVSSSESRRGSDWDTDTSVMHDGERYELRRESRSRRSSARSNLRNGARQRSKSCSVFKDHADKSLLKRNPHNLSQNNVPSDNCDIETDIDDSAAGSYEFHRESRSRRKRTRSSSRKRVPQRSRSCSVVKNTAVNSVLVVNPRNSSPNIVREPGKILRRSGRGACSSFIEEGYSTTAGVSEPRYELRGRSRSRRNDDIGSGMTGRRNRSKSCSVGDYGRSRLVESQRAVKPHFDSTFSDGCGGSGKTVSGVVKNLASDGYKSSPAYGSDIDESDSDVTGQSEFQRRTRSSSKMNGESKRRRQRCKSCSVGVGRLRRSVDPKLAVKAHPLNKTDFASTSGRAKSVENEFPTEKRLTRSAGYLRFPDFAAHIDGNESCITRRYELRRMHSQSDRKPEGNRNQRHSRSRKSRQASDNVISPSKKNQQKSRPRDAKATDMSGYLSCPETTFEVPVGGRSRRRKRLPGLHSPLQNDPYPVCADSTSLSKTVENGSPMQCGACKGMPDCLVRVVPSKRRRSDSPDKNATQHHLPKRQRHHSEGYTNVDKEPRGQPLHLSRSLHGLSTDLEHAGLAFDKYRDIQYFLTGKGEINSAKSRSCDALTQIRTDDRLKQGIGEHGTENGYSCIQDADQPHAVSRSSASSPVTKWWKKIGTFLHIIERRDSDESGIGSFDSRVSHSSTAENIADEQVGRVDPTAAEKAPFALVSAVQMPRPDEQPPSWLLDWDIFPAGDSDGMASGSEDMFLMDDQTQKLAKKRRPKRLTLKKRKRRDKDELDPDMPREQRIQLTKDPNIWHRFLPINQRIMLAEYVVGNRELARHYCLGGDENPPAWDDFWIEWASRLNLCDPGFIMTPDQWKATFVNWRTDIRRLLSRGPETWIHALTQLELVLIEPPEKSEELYLKIRTSPMSCLGPSCPRVWCVGACGVLNTKDDDGTSTWERIQRERYLHRL